MFNFQGKRVLVTGGTSGIGRAIAQAFSLAGADVLALGLAFEESLPAPIETKILDVTDTAAVDKVVSSLSALHVVVNAAGMIRRDEEFDLDVFTRVLDVNLISVMRVCMAAHPKLRLSRGSIINIASLLSFLAALACPHTAQARAALRNSHALWPSRGLRITFA